MSGRSTTQFAVLGLLTIEPMSGYDLRKHFHESLSYFWSESNGQIYPTLKTLAVNRLITLASTKQTGKRPRQKYALTRAGRKQLQQWLAMPAQPQPPRNEFLLKLFLGRSAPEGAIMQHLLRLRTQQEELLAMFFIIRDSIRKEHARSADLKYWMLMLDHGIRLRRAEIDWCNAARGVLGDKPKGSRQKERVSR